MRQKLVHRKLADCKHSHARYINKHMHRPTLTCSSSIAYSSVIELNKIIIRLSTDEEQIESNVRQQAGIFLSPVFFYFPTDLHSCLLYTSRCV